MYQKSSSTDIIHRHKTLPLSIRNYSCKFIPYHHDVYLIHRYNKSEGQPHYKNMEYFTAPFFLRQFHGHDIERNPSNFNVLITFACPHQARHVVHQIQRQKEKNEVFFPRDMLLKRMSVKEASYHASIIRVPLVTVLNSYCDTLDRDESEETHEIFYTTRFLNDA